MPCAFQRTDFKAHTISKILRRRRQSFFITSLFALVEFANEISLPNAALDHPRIQEIQELGIEITILHSDLVSYHKEVYDEITQNTVVACEKEGMTSQGAFDFIGLEINSRLSRLEEVTQSVARWTSIWRDDLMRYIGGVELIIKANLYWRFHSGNFLSDRQKIRLLTTHKLDVSQLSTDVQQEKVADQRPDCRPDPEQSKNTFGSSSIFNAQWYGGSVEAPRFTGSPCQLEEAYLQCDVGLWQIEQTA